MPSPTTPGPARSSDATLADADRAGAEEAAASTLSPPNPNKYDAYLSGTTTRAATPTEDENEKQTPGTPAEDEKEKQKPGAPTEDEKEKQKPETSGSIKAEPAEVQDDTEYPTGWTFTFIVVALVLSIFLVSLDMVCVLVHHVVVPPSRTLTHTRPSWQPPFLESQTSSGAWKMSPGMAQPSS